MREYIKYLLGAITIFIILFLAIGWNLPAVPCHAADQGKSYYAPDYQRPKDCAATLGSHISSFFSNLIGDKDVRDELLVLFTALLAIFTFLLFRSTEGLLRHAPLVERAYISGGGVPIVRATTPEFELHINNHGKTPGEILQIGIGFCDAFSIPPVPDYILLHFQDWIGPGTQSRPIHRIPIPENLLPSPAIYGRFWYRDIFGKDHSSGFILSLEPNGSAPLMAPTEYTRTD